MDRSC